ncbi:putative ribonuclease H protein [Camellia lanceoleosa]|uniref:Ribonuclease H protein n=1 Tax=Camellia lanceoleosa TaxID=1840588 RepID=A0ACC0F1V4_9ERIC|nr:putative ribonuclease H protein [Camellia lanceoleosa]
MRRQLSLNSTSSLSGHYRETTPHALQDCQRAKKVWHELIPPPQWLRLFSLPLVSWMDTNLGNCPWVRPDVQSWILLFLASISSLCFWHNKQLHDPTFKQPYCPVAYLKGRVKEFEAAKISLAKGSSTPKGSSQWISPPEGWVKINVDGAVAQRSGRVGVGGLI